jgi:hypothetical protein
MRNHVGVIRKSGKSGKETKIAVGFLVTAGESLDGYG